MANRRLSDYSFNEIHARIMDRLYAPMRKFYRRLAPSRLLLTRSYLLDDEWYMHQYPDVIEAGTTPVKHYLRHGARENRDPSPFFSTRWYRDQYPEIASSEQNPLVHFLRIGEDEGRLTGPSFRRRRVEQKPKLSKSQQLRSEQQREKIGKKLKSELNTFVQSNSQLDFSKKSLNPLDPLVSVVIVTWNKAEFTLATLQSLLKSNHSNLEVIVVDNGSTDETHVLIDRLRGAKKIFNAENQGFVRAVNEGVRQATGEYVLLLNNDATPGTESIGRAARYLASNSDVAAVGGRLILPSGLLQEAGSVIWNDGSCEGYLRNEPPEIGEAMFLRDVDFCSAAFLMFRAKVWHDLKGFDEKYSPAYYEEVDLCARALSEGHRIVYLPDVVTEHFEFASTAGLAEASKMQLDRRKIFVESQGEFLRLQSDVNDHSFVTARSRSKAPEVLIVDDQIPRESAGQGFARVVRLIQTFKESGYRVCVAATAHEGVVDWPAIWQELGQDVECIPDLSPRTLEAFLSERAGSYQLLWVSRPHNLRYVKEILDRRPGLINCPVVYDAEALVTANQLASRGQAVSQEDLGVAARDEVALTSIAQAIVCVSPLDQAAFKANTNKPVFVAAHALARKPTSEDFSSRQGLLFFGALTNLNSPNVESLEWFLVNVWQKMPQDFRDSNPFRIVGQILPSLAKKWKKPDVEVVGLVQDLWQEANHAKVFVAPTQRAQGIPIKVLEAASLGLPSIITPVLAQQLQWTNNVEALVASDPKEFADAIESLSSDEKLWQKIRENAMHAAERICNPNDFKKAVLDAASAAGVNTPTRQ